MTQFSRFPSLLHISAIIDASTWSARGF